MVVFAPNLAWRDEPLKRFLEEELDLPVVVENDANAAAWGEFTFGAGEDVDDLLMLTVGTGVGGGVVIDGELVRGGFGMGGEVGHITMVPGGVPVRVRQPRLPGVLRLRQRPGAASPASSRAPTPSRPKGLVARAGGDPARITGPLVTEAAQDGDPFAIARLAELGDWLGQGVATLTAVLDPNVVVIGGGVSEAGDLLLDPIRRQLRAARHRPRAPADARDPAGAARQRRRHDRRRRPGETPVSAERSVIPSIGVDIGGTKVLAAVVDSTGRVLDTEATATPGHGLGPEGATAAEVEDALVDVTSRLLAVYGRCPVGVAAAGFVDRDAQRVRFAPHLPWRDEPLSKRLNARLAGRIQGDVLVDNDATAALWAEGRFGAARGHPRRRDDHARHRHRRRADGARRAAPRRQRDGRRVRAHAGGPGRPLVPVRSPGLLGAVLLRSRAGPGRRGGGLRPVRAGADDGGLRG